MPKRNKQIILKWQRSIIDEIYTCLFSSCVSLSSSGYVIADNPQPFLKPSSDTSSVTGSGALHHTSSVTGSGALHHTSSVTGSGALHHTVSSPLARTQKKVHTFVDSSLGANAGPVTRLLDWSSPGPWHPKSRLTDGPLLQAPQPAESYEMQTKDQIKLDGKCSDDEDAPEDLHLLRDKLRANKRPAIRPKYIQIISDYSSQVKES